MVPFLKAQSHYLNQWWLIIKYIMLLSHIMLHLLVLFWQFNVKLLKSTKLVIELPQSWTKALIISTMSAYFCRIQSSYIKNITSKALHFVLMKLSLTGYLVNKYWYNSFGYQPMISMPRPDQTGTTRTPAFWDTPATPWSSKLVIHIRS